ncbi:hypothetical protein QFZ62_002747 [Clavibacter sp. B3I6]|nr:hypothetical protein [Clavibacter sp. B3I6]
MRTHHHHDDHGSSRSHDGSPAAPHEPRMQHHRGGRPRIMPGHPLARGFHPGEGGSGFPGFPGFPGMGGFGGPGFGGGFGPGRGRGGRGRARRGDVRLAILSLLAEAPSNGYGLITGIAAKSEGAWRPSPGSVYPTLQHAGRRGPHRRRRDRREERLLPHGRGPRPRRRAPGGDRRGLGRDHRQVRGRGRVPDESHEAHGRGEAPHARRDRRPAPGRGGEARRDAARAVRDPRRLIPHRRTRAAHDDGPRCCGGRRRACGRRIS